MLPGQSALRLKKRKEITVRDARKIRIYFQS